MGSWHFAYWGTSPAGLAHGVGANWLHLQPEKQPQRQTAVWASCLEPGGLGAEWPHKTAPLCLSALHF